MVTKTCIRCREELESTNFYKSSASKDGLKNECKECRRKNRKISDKEKQKAKEYKQKNKDVLSEKGRAYHLANKEKANKVSREYYHENKDKERERHDKWERNNILKRLAISCNKRNKEKHGPLEKITEQMLRDIYDKQEGLCFYSGEVLKVRRDPGDVRHKLQVSVDRIDSSKGYIVGNMVLSCWKVNQMKNDQPLDEFISWCEKISKKMLEGGYSARVEGREAT